MLYLNTPPPIGNYEACVTACDYELRVKWSGTDADDNQLYLTGVNVAQNEDIYLAEKYLINTADLPALVTQLNSLEVGTFTADVTSGWLYIRAKQTQIQLNALHFEQEGHELDVLFKQLNCTTESPCESGVKRCQYALYRQLEADGATTDQWKMSVTGIVYSGNTYLTQPIDTSNTVALKQFLSTRVESEDKVSVAFDQTELKLRVEFGSIMARPVKLLFLEESYDTQTSGTITTTSETSFVQFGCGTQCCEDCGGLGQPPCKNPNHQCDNGLTPDANNRCVPACIAGKRYVNGEWQPAGGIGQFPDCAGNCNDGLVIGEDGACRSADINNTVCTLIYEADANPNDEFLGITIGGSIGTRKPAKGILFGTGTEILAWLNSPEAGICPDDTACWTLNPVTDTPDSESLKHYEFVLANVAIAIPSTGIQSPIEMTKKWCGDDAAGSCLSATGCSVQEANPDCTYGNHWDNEFWRCVANSYTTEAPSVNGRGQQQQRGTQSRVGHTKPCNANYNNYAHKANIDELVVKEIAEMTKQSGVVEALRQRAEAVGAIFDLNREARKRLISKGKLPSYEAFCYVLPNGTLLNL